MGMDDYLLGGSLSLDPLLRESQMRRRRDGAKWRRQGSHASILWGIDYDYRIGYDAEDRRIKLAKISQKRFEESEEGKLMNMVCDYLKKKK